MVQRRIAAVASCMLVCGWGVFAVASAPTAHAFEEHHVDFNGDGYADLVITASGKAVGSNPQAGQITVMYGSSTGLKPTTAQVFNEDTPGVPEAAHARDLWGFTHAVGDFNGDGYDDLAVGGQDTVAAERNAGTVTVLWGSASGLTTSGAVLYTGQTVVSAARYPSSFFGEGLAAGDFDGDGFADLAIGAPGVSHGAAHTGLIVVLHGSHSGLVNPHQLIEQGSNGVPGTRETNDWFGDTLLTADLDHDGRDDLLIGDADESAGSATYAGVVYRLWGSPTGLTSSGAIVAVGGNPIAHRYLGAWLAVVPGTEAVYAWAPGDDTHPSFVAQVQVDRSAGGSPAVVRRYTDSAPNLGLGAGMVAGNFGGGFNGMLMLGDPGARNGAGQIEFKDLHGVLHYVNRETQSVPGVDQPDSNLGVQLTAEDFNHDGYDDLVVSVPFESLGSVPEAGEFYIFPGSSHGIYWGSGHIVTQETPGIPSTSQPHDWWGWV